MFTMPRPRFATMCKFRAPPNLRSIRISVGYDDRILVRPQIVYSSGFGSATPPKPLEYFAVAERSILPSLE
jgi:hypothetical protein